MRITSKVAAAMAVAGALFAATAQAQGTFNYFTTGQFTNTLGLTSACNDATPMATTSCGANGFGLTFDGVAPSPFGYQSGSQITFGTFTPTGTGTATVTYNAATKMTTVKVTVQHLEPGSVHPSHVHGGTCRSNGPVLEGLMSVKANAHGTGVATTTFAGAIKTPAYINVHMGPGLALTQFTVLTCGNVTKGM